MDCFNFYFLEVTTPITSFPCEKSLKDHFFSLFFQPISVEGREWGYGRKPKKKVTTILVSGEEEQYLENEIDRLCSHLGFFAHFCNVTLFDVSIVFLVSSSIVS
jgi:hypothetical protein